MKLEFVELHSPLFLGGKNHGTKVFNKGGISIEHDAVADKLKISYNGQTAHVQHYNYFVESPETPVAKLGTRAAYTGKIKAQISTPQDHVFSSGAGKTND